MRMPKSGPAEVSALVAWLQERALAGKVCPSNMAVAGHFGFSSVASAARLFQLAERAGLIIVERGQAARVVTAPDGSWRTAGDAGAPHWRIARGEGAAERDWTEAEIADLRRLWPDRSLSVAAIGERLGRSKSAVAGQVFRLQMPRRSGRPPAPKGGRKPPTALRVAPSAPAPDRGASPPPARRLDALPSRTGTGSWSAHSPSVVLPLRKREPLPVLGQRTPGSTCRWPLWAFGAKPDMRFCDAPRDPSCRAPYCAHHRMVARAKDQAA